MADDRELQSGKTVELDVTPPALDQAEWDKATRIVMEQVSSDYDLAIDPGPQARAIVTVPEQDLSPSWAELRAHCARLAPSMPQYEDPPLPSFPDDEAAELRLYPIRRKDRPADEEPSSVVISWTLGKVVSFNQSEPEREESTSSSAGA